MTSGTLDTRSSSWLSAEPELGRWRSETPGCAHRNHLNNAGAALMPSPVIRAIEDHLRLEPTIGGYEAAEERAPEARRAYDATVVSFRGGGARRMKRTCVCLWTSRASIR